MFGNRGKEMTAENIQEKNPKQEVEVILNDSQIINQFNRLVKENPSIEQLNSLPAAVQSLKAYLTEQLKDDKNTTYVLNTWGALERAVNKVVNKDTYAFTALVAIHEFRNAARDANLSENAKDNIMQIVLGLTLLSLVAGFAMALVLSNPIGIGLGVSLVVGGFFVINSFQEILEHFGFRKEGPGFFNSKEKVGAEVQQQLEALSSLIRNPLADINPAPSSAVTPTGF